VQPTHTPKQSREHEQREIRVVVEEHVSHDVVRPARGGRAALGVCWDTRGFEALGHKQGTKQNANRFGWRLLRL
jgi:hypothetical protein